ncbi:MAG: winged helix DNA-binding domain-containing protein, partial [Gemmatimonadota bacterium]|nr:winged helix DNA-binding domain-containing protein [Gemmatimonadota bacterium]
VVDGRTYWFAASTPAVKGTPGTAHLLPNYDEYFIGLKDRSAIQELVKGRVVGIPGDMFFANLVVADGQLVGGWTRTVTSRVLRIHVRLAVKVTGVQLRSIEAQARRYGEFLRLPVELEIAA